MKLNKFIAQNTALSRRGADDLIAAGRVAVNGRTAETGQDIAETDTVAIDSKEVDLAERATVTIMLNKPAGYVCSRRGQGSKTVYDLLPEEVRHLNLVGRLDKESSGLLLLTTDGELANQLTHPRYQKAKVYEVQLDKPLAPLHQQMISNHGTELEDGKSRFAIDKMDESGKQLRVTLNEGRNRQIRRTFNSVGYEVLVLHRSSFGDYKLGSLGAGELIYLS